MKMTRSQQWISGAFLGAVVLIMAGLVYRIVASQVDPNYSQWTRQRDAAKPPAVFSWVTDQRVVLMKDEPVTVGRTRMIYRGMADGNVRVDLYLLDMDGEYAYPRCIPVSAEAAVVRLGGGSYRLVSAHRRQVVMKRID